MQQLLKLVKNIAKVLTEVNPLMGATGRPDYSATSNNMKLVHWPLMGGLLRLVGLERRGD